MNTIYNKTIFSFLAIVLSISGFAKQVPPPPSGEGRGPGGPGPGLPIDDNLLFFMILMMIFGLYKIYNFNSKKTSI